MGSNTASTFTPNGGQQCGDLNHRSSCLPAYRQCPIDSAPSSPMHGEGMLPTPTHSEERRL
jgi:hypothetical protein